MVPGASKPFLAGGRGIDEHALALPGAITFAFFRDRGTVMVPVYQPSGRSLRTVVATDAIDLPSPIFEAKSSAFVVVLVPSRSVCLGPIPLIRYVMHRNGGPPIAELSALEARRRTIEQIEREVPHLDVPQDVSPR